VKPYEVILIDDGSIDDGRRICNKYASLHVEEHWVVVHTENRGVSSARNLGLTLVRGDYVSFMDADDAYVLNAIETMQKYARKGLKMAQFGHYRHRLESWGVPELATAPSGFYGFDYTPQFTSMVWNKMYSMEFLRKNNIRFDKSLTFGEDEIFNTNCILKLNGIYCATDVTCSHYFDDKNSICRGGLCKEWLEELDRRLVAIRNAQTDKKARDWLYFVINLHRDSGTYQMYGAKPQGALK
jgi:glycosyltransferase involved in cell wall biosynthesis